MCLCDCGCRCGQVGCVGMCVGVSAYLCMGKFVSSSECMHPFLCTSECGYMCE